MRDVVFIALMGLIFLELQILVDFALSDDNFLADFPIAQTCQGDFITNIITKFSKRNTIFLNRIS